MLVTALEIGLGLCLSSAISLPLSIIMFKHPSIDAALTPFLVASQAIPVFAVAPLWSFGSAMVFEQIVMATIVIFFPYGLHIFRL